MPMMWEKHPMFMTWLYTTDTILITTSCTEAQSRIEATSKINVKGFVDIVIICRETSPVMLFLSTLCDAIQNEKH